MKQKYLNFTLLTIYRTAPLIHSVGAPKDGDDPTMCTAALSILKYELLRHPAEDGYVYGQAGNDA